MVVFSYLGNGQLPGNRSIPLALEPDNVNDFNMLNVNSLQITSLHVSFCCMYTPDQILQEPFYIWLTPLMLGIKFADLLDSDILTWNQSCTRAAHTNGFQALNPNLTPCVQDNDLEREFAVHRTEQDYAAAEFWKWALSILIGATMGTLAFLVDWGIDVLNTSKYTAVNNRIYGEGAHRALTLYPRWDTLFTACQIHHLVTDCRVQTL